MYSGSCIAARIETGINLNRTQIYYCIYLFQEMRLTGFPRMFISKYMNILIQYFNKM